MNNIIFDNTLITGGSGMVGSNINFGIKPTSNEMDVTSLLSINKYISNINNISCIIHLVAANLRESDSNVISAINLNIDGTTNMLNIAKSKNIPFVLISSGAVFSDEDKTQIFYETTETCPNSVYGHTKSSSEKISLLYDKTILIRTGWLFGGNQKLHIKFVESCINNLTLNQCVKASNDFYGSPTYVMDLIDEMKNLITESKFGIHHIINDGKACGYDIGLEICNFLKKDPTLIHSSRANIIPNSGPYRSATEVLGTSNLNKLRDWRIALCEYIGKYMHEQLQSSNKSWSNRETCRLCNSYNIETFFNLAPTPPANHFIKEIKYQEKIPLDIAICTDCKHIQLIQIVNPSLQYSNYFYVSSTSNVMINHLKSNVMEFVNSMNIDKSDNILEIGANDGVCVQHLLENGYTNIIGIDPAENINKRHSLPIICDFFGSSILDSFKTKYGEFAMIYSFHCCAHIENIQDVFRTIYELLNKDGVFIMEVGYFYEVFKNKSFDTIYHEHIDYHTCSAMKRFAEFNNMVLFDIKKNNIQGGSVQFYISKDTTHKIETSVYATIEQEYAMGIFNKPNLLSWKSTVLLNGRDIKYILTSFVENGKRIAGYGASAKSTTFLHQYNLSNKLIDFIIDDNIYKHNYYTPGLHIPINPITIMDTEKVDYILILSWNFTNEIIKKLQPYIKNGIRIIVPFPDIRIL